MSASTDPRILEGTNAVQDRVSATSEEIGPQEVVTFSNSSGFPLASESRPCTQSKRNPKPLEQ